MAENAGPTEVRLASGDRIELSVEVDGNMEVSRHRAPVNFSGQVTLPLVGDVHVGGLRLEQARQVIANAYGSYYVNSPVIMLTTIEDLDAGVWGTVTVTGKVGRPGVIPITSAQGVRLSAVLQSAGGFAASAKQGSILVTRTNLNGQRIQVSVNYNEIGQEGNAAADINLMDGDIVYVPERIF
jgi:polysaccharide biosynthesis/export protein